MAMINLCAALVVAAVGAGPSANAELHADNALITLIEQVETPARVAGVLATVDVREGQSVAAGQQLAHVEDSESRLARDRADLERQVAAREADNDVSVRFARKSAEVATAELRRATDSVSKYEKSVSDSEIDRLRLTAQRTALEIEQADHDLDVARINRELKEKEVETAEAELARHQLLAPIDGVVVEVRRRPGEWVEPGQVVVRLMRVDRLRVETFLDAAQIDHGAVGSPAELTIDLPGRAAERFTGEVVFVSPEVDPVNGQVLVWAEVENRDRLLRPGLRGRLTIRPSPPTETAAR